MNDSNAFDIVLDNSNANICVDGRSIGTINYSINPYHAEHYYLKLNLQYYDAALSKKIFNMLGKKLNKPMQVMISSSEQSVISFLSAAGFLCKRKCYEVEASAQDYVGEKTKHSVPVARKESPVYDKCCKMMLERYVLTHAKVSPWTGSAEQFFENLPETVFYEIDGRQIINLAFIEDNEIAYVCGCDIPRFVVFVQSIITKLLAEHKSVVFEADDCDEYAMALKNLFADKTDESFDTYIL